MTQPMQPAPVAQPLYYVGVAEFEARIGRELLIAVFDDKNTGAPDPAAVWLHLVDSQTYVEAFVRAGDYDLLLCRQRGPALDTVRKLILDHAEATAFIRHPEIARYDGEKALSRIRIDCLDIQKHNIRLDLGPLDAPPENVGGATRRIGMGGRTPHPVFDDLGDLPGGHRG